MSFARPSCDAVRFRSAHSLVGDLAGVPDMYFANSRCASAADRNEGLMCFTCGQDLSTGIFTLLEHPVVPAVAVCPRYITHSPLVTRSVQTTSYTPLE